MFQRHSQLVAPSRFTLEKNQVFRLPKTYREVQVVSGTAWITVDREDIIVRSGEKASLPNPQNFAVISALSQTPLILEAIGNGGG